MYRHTFNLTPARAGVTYSSLRKLIEHRLASRLQARGLEIEGNAMRFRGLSWVRRPLPWTLLSGRIDINPEANQVTWRLRLWPQAIPATLLVGLWGLGMAVVVWGSVIPALGFVLLVWLMAVGFSCGITLALFDGFMRRCFRDAGFAISKRRPPANG